MNARQALVAALVAAVAAAACAPPCAASPASSSDGLSDELDEFVRSYVAALSDDPLASDDKEAARELMEDSIRRREKQLKGNGGGGAGRGSGGEDGLDTTGGARLHHMWTSPIFVANVADFGLDVAEFNGAIASHVMKQYLGYVGGADGDAAANLKRILKSHDQEAVTEAWNNGFWNWQVNQGGWRKAVSKLPEVAKLMEIMNEMCDTFLNELGVPYERTVGRSHDVSEDAWATVHSHSVFHMAHLHEDSMISAVFYLKTPPQSGPITFYDPRGPHPPFDREISIHPRHGDIVLFPSWLLHQVMPTAGRETRMSIAVNFAGKWKATGATRVSLSTAQHVRHNAKMYRERGADWRRDVLGREKQLSDPKATGRHHEEYVDEEEAAARGVRPDGIDHETKEFEVENRDMLYGEEDADGGEYEYEYEDADGDGYEYEDEEGAEAAPARGVTDKDGYASYLDDDDDDDDDDGAAGGNLYAYDPDREIPGDDDDSRAQRLRREVAAKRSAREKRKQKRAAAAEDDEEPPARRKAPKKAPKKAQKAPPKKNAKKPKAAAAPKKKPKKASKAAKKRAAATGPSIDVGGATTDTASADELIEALEARRKAAAAKKARK